VSFKSPVQPLCRCCGKGIRKATSHVWFGHDAGGLQNSREPTVYRTERPRTVEEAARLVNERIVHNSRSRDKSYINKVSIWDGETWEDEFFCGAVCAAGYGWFAVKNPGYETRAYAEARRKRGAKDLP
jgi:hypothetical protein